MILRQIHDLHKDIHGHNQVKFQLTLFSKCLNKPQQYLFFVIKFGSAFKIIVCDAIPDFMNNAINKSEIIIHSDGSPTRSFCYVSDAISAFFKLLFSKHDGIICNVGNDEEVNVKKVASMIQNIIEGPISIKMIKSEDLNYTKDNPQRRCPDLSLIKKSINHFIIKILFLFSYPLGKISL